jgi:MoxR-like ATPase
MAQITENRMRLAAEDRCQQELDALRAIDTFEKPVGWGLSPKMVEVFLMGSPHPVTAPDGTQIAIRPKYIGDKYRIQVAIATLASDRALLLMGDPGTAKSWLSEHLAAAISGSSRLTVQGTAGTTEDQIKYSWNYALLLANGPTPVALVKSPIFRAMESGTIARIEEITRVTSEIQDALISLLSEKLIAIPELGTDVAARKGFNIIATANTRDRGINEMSSALKRRFNFVHVPVINDLELEMQIVAARTRELQSEFEVRGAFSADIVKLLATVFQELREGKSKDGAIKIKQPSTVLSAAEMISVLFNGVILANHFGSAEVTPEEIARSVIGAISKEQAQDTEILLEYCETVARRRKDTLWQGFYQSVKKAVSSF